MHFDRGPDHVPAESIRFLEVLVHRQFLASTEGNEGHEGFLAGRRF